MNNAGTLNYRAATWGGPAQDAGSTYPCPRGVVDWLHSFTRVNSVRVSREFCVMASAEEVTLVRKLLSTLITALANGDELSPVRLSRALRDAVCARGLYIDTNFDILHVIDQLARFRSGVKSSDQLRLFLTEKHHPNSENFPGKNKKVCTPYY